MGIDWKPMMCRVQCFGKGDKVEEQRRDGGGDSYMPPAGAVVESGWQNSQRGDAIKKDCDSEPKE